jgi:hypothetical protein
MNDQAAPFPALSAIPPIIAVLPSALMETLSPWLATPAAPEPTSLIHFCCQISPDRVNVQAAPSPILSALPPMMAVLPSAVNEILFPILALLLALVPTNLLPCCVQVSLFLVNTQAAPLLLSSSFPPMMAVLPSALIDSFHPC